MYVIQVSGKIENMDNKSFLKPSDILTGKEKLKFYSADSKAVVMSKEKGRMVIQNQKAKASSDKQSEFIAMLVDALIPMPTNHQLSSRNLMATNVVSNFTDFFGKEKYVFIGDRIIIPLDPSKYPLSDEKVIVYRYMIGEKPVQKILKHYDNNVIFDKKQIYLHDNEAIPLDKTSKEVHLYYVNKKTKATTELVSFEPVYLNENDLYNELNALITYLKTIESKSEEDMKPIILEFVQTAHGKVNAKILEQWLYAKKLLQKSQSTDKSSEEEEVITQDPSENVEAPNYTEEELIQPVKEEAEEENNEKIGEAISEDGDGK
ncbi:MAG: hypothetical protein OHK0038_07590 [Flammeovirgaceae bacterium]